MNHRYLSVKMPIAALYSWSENEASVEVVIPLKGNKASTADVFAAESYIKVSFGPYLLELDLVGRIDDTRVRASPKDGSLILKLHKLHPKLWGELAMSTKGVDRAVLRERRRAAVEARRQKEEQLQEQAKSRRIDIERTTLQAQMAMEGAERQELEDLKAEEKRRAEEEVYQTFSRLEAERRKQQEEEQGADAAPPRRRVTFAEDAPAATRKEEEEEQSRGVAVDASCPCPPLVECDGGGTGAAARKGPPSSDIFDDIDDDIDDDDDGDDGYKAKLGGEDGGGSGGAVQEERETAPEHEEEEEDSASAAYVPAPRNMDGGGRVKIGFTPRVFPTPMRESKRQEEEDWIARNRPHLQSNKTLSSLGGDARDISESDPVWLKGKGDDFFRAGDYRSAANAYTASLEVRPDQPKVLSNRAACYVQLGGSKAKECIDDCTKGLALAVVAGVDGGQGGGGASSKSEMGGEAGTGGDAGGSITMAVYENKLLRMRLHVRRATAYCQLGDFDKAAEDFRAALYHSADDADLAADLSRVEALAHCSKLKRRADEHVAQEGGDDDKQRLHTALKLYGEALAVVPTFASCLSNRAAVHLALGDLPSCVEDCSRALQCLEEGGADTSLSSSSCLLSGVPPVGSERRRVWALRTLARRGAARAAMGGEEQLRAARQDYVEAVSLAKGSKEEEELSRDVREIEDRIAAVALEREAGTGEPE